MLLDLVESSVFRLFAVVMPFDSDDFSCSDWELKWAPLIKKQDNLVRIQYPNIVIKPGSHKYIGNDSSKPANTFPIRSKASLIFSKELAYTIRR